MTRPRPLYTPANCHAAHRLYWSLSVFWLGDHIHMVIGCAVHETPQDVVLGYMNNLAYAYGMRPVLASGYYAATVGEYDRGALGRSAGENE